MLRIGIAALRANDFIAPTLLFPMPGLIGKNNAWLATAALWSPGASPIMSV